jgi:beta-galactosidase
MFTNDRQHSLFDAGWMFTRGDVTGAEAPGFDDSGWRSLDLPHDWSIELSYNPDSPAGRHEGYLEGGIGWYRRSFVLPQEYAGKRILIQFDGANMNSDVWINGHHLGHRPYGYSAFIYDLTTYVNVGGGVNVIAVRVNHPQPATRWYSGSGIYRHVWLTVVNPVHIADWGTFVHTASVSTGSATVSVSTEVKNQSSDTSPVAVLTTILDADGRPVAADRSDASSVAANSQSIFNQTLTVENPKLWSPASPYLYQVRTQVMVGDTMADIHHTPLGIRSFRFDPGQGFFLNGQRVKIQGICLHDDLGALGAAVNYRAFERRVEILKEMGCNAIRTAHNPPAPELLDACDRLGMLVKDEAFDCWETAKTAYDYHLYFEQWAEADIKTMVRRDRNHPCVIMWSIGNEILNPTVSTAQRLKDWARQEDPTRPVTWASNGMARRDHQEAVEILDLAGYNYGIQFYDIDHQKYPSRPIFGSETCAARRSRSVYLFPPWRVFYPGDPDIGSSYDNCLSKWGRISAEQDWKDHTCREFIAGEFIWTGFDYPGENDWPAKSNNAGIVDTCGFPKGIYYFYKSQWTCAPMVHILPHWNWEPGQTVTVFVYTNCDSVELFLNGSSLGCKSPRPGRELHLEWDVPYTPGTLRAVGSRGGAVLTTCEVKTAGAPARVDLAVDRSIIKADGQDLAFITADIVDANGVLVPTADNQVGFSISGPGKIAGVDNGNSLSHEMYKANNRQAFGGKCLAIVQSNGTAGQIVVTAGSTGLASGSVTINGQGT